MATGKSIKYNGNYCVGGWLFGWLVEFDKICFEENKNDGLIIGSRKSVKYKMH